MPRISIGRTTRPAHRWTGSPLVRLARHRWTYWVVAVALVVATVWVVSDLTADAARARSSWGELRTVLVATHRLDPGDPITPADVDRRDLPPIAVPDDAIAELPVEARVTDTIHPGDVVREVRLGAAGDALPPGTAAVAVTLGPGSPGLSRGDRVQLWTVVDPLSPRGAEPVATDALVIRVEDGAAVVAVDHADLGATALALDRGPVTVAVTR